MTINIADFGNKPLGDKAQPRITAEEVDIWNATQMERTSRGVLPRGLARQIARWDEDLEKASNEARLVLDSLHAETWTDSPFKCLLTELYGGNVACSEEAVRRHHNVGRPRDIIFGDDLLDHGMQNETLDSLDADNPYLTIVSFPCDPFTPISNFFPEGVKEEKKIVGFQHLIFVKRVRDNCLNRRAHMLLENPLASQAWKFMKWLDTDDFAKALTHQCGEGSELVDFLGDPVNKPTRFYTTAVCLADRLNSIRCTGDHHHAEVIDRPRGVSASLAHWTPELANSIIDGILQQKSTEDYLANCRVVYAGELLKMTAEQPEMFV